MHLIKQQRTLKIHWFSFDPKQSNSLCNGHIYVAFPLRRIQCYQAGYKKRKSRKSFCFTHDLKTGRERIKTFSVKNGALPQNSELLPDPDCLWGKL